MNRRVEGHGRPVQEVVLEALLARKDGGNPFVGDFVTATDPLGRTSFWGVEQEWGEMSVEEIEPPPWRSREARERRSNPQGDVPVIEVSVPGEGWLPAVRARDLEIGDLIIWRDERRRVEEVEDATPHFMEVTLKDSWGQLGAWRMKKDHLVAVVSED